MATTIKNTIDVQTIDATHGHRIFTVQLASGKQISARVTLTAPAGRTGGQSQWLADAATEITRAMDTQCANGPSAHQLTSHTG